MKLTNLLRMKLPEGKDPVNVEDFNDNFKAIDKELENMQTSAGDASKNTVTFSTAAERTNVASTETLGTLMGKIAKWFTDMKAAAFAGIANNETTNTDGFVLDARIGKKHSDQLNGLYFGTDAKGKWGFKTSQGGTVTPFRNPTGNAAAADVLSGKVFSSAELEDATGSMPNNGAWVGETTGNGNVAIPAGYHSGDGYVSGAGAYNKGVSDADRRVNTECASYKSGYANGRKYIVDAFTLQNTTGNNNFAVYDFGKYFSSYEQFLSHSICALAGYGGNTGSFGGSGYCVYNGAEHLSDNARIEHLSATSIRIKHYQGGNVGSMINFIIIFQ